MEKKSDEKEFAQILAILTGCLSVLTSGFLYAWPSPFIVKISEDKVSYNITEEEASYFIVFNAISMTLAPLLVPLVNTIGRKKSLLLASIPYITSLLIKAFARDAIIFYIARFIYGIGDAINYISFPIYIGEIATPKVRGLWGNAMSCAAFSGYFLVNLLGNYFTVQQTSLISLSIPILFVATFSTMPESPYYYIMKNNDDKARASLRRLRGKDDIDKEFQEIKNTVKQQLEEAKNWKDIFTVRSNRIALQAGMFLRIAQHFSGFYAFSTFTQLIFKKSGSNFSAETSSLIYTATIVVTFTSAAYFCDKLGRRKSFMLSLSAAAFIVLTEGIYFYFEAELVEMRWFPVVGMVCFVVAASLGIGFVPIITTSELFSAGIKAQAVALITCVHAIGGFVVSIVFYYLNDWFGLGAPFLFFFGCNVASVVVTYFVVPETRGKTLEEIQQMLKQM